MVNINVMSSSLEGIFMKRFHNERGFAMIEVLLAVSIFAVISLIALTNVNNSFKTVYVNHEIINLYSKMRFLQNANRICNYNQEDVFHYLTPNSGNQKINIFRIESSKKNRYNLDIAGNDLDEHKLLTNFSFEDNFYIYTNYEKVTSTIRNSYASNPVAFKLKILNHDEICNPVIIVDSVGRIRINDN